MQTSSSINDYLSCASLQHSGSPHSQFSSIGHRVTLILLSSREIVFIHGFSSFVFTLLETPRIYQGRHSCRNISLLRLLLSQLRTSPQRSFHKERSNKRVRHRLQLLHHIMGSFLFSFYITSESAIFLLNF